MPILTVVLGRIPLKVYDLDKPLITIGRVPGHDIVIDNPSVSRTQAEVERQDDGTWVVRDAGSANGTFVNGEYIKGDRRLEPGDAISMGKYSVVFERAFEVQAPSPPRSTPQDSGPVEGTMMLKASEVWKLTHTGDLKRHAHIEWECRGQRGTFALAETGAVLVGSDDLCDLRIAGAPNRIVIVGTGSSYEARNLCSFRRMRVGGARARRAKLGGGDKIAVGGLTLTFVDELR